MKVQATEVEHSEVAGAGNASVPIVGQNHVVEWSFSSCECGILAHKDFGDSLCVFICCVHVSLDT